MDSQPTHLKYLHAPEKPANFDGELLKIVGVCPNNLDPYLRFVWGMDVTARHGEKEVHRYPDPDGKYVGLPFWILEGWQSPDVYDRIEWETKKDVLGEFPAGGVWDFIEVYRTPDYRFMPLGGSALQKAREWKFWKSKPKARAIADLIAHREELEKLREHRAAEYKQKIYDNFVVNWARAAADIKNARSTFGTKTKPEPFRRGGSGLFLPGND